MTNTIAATTTICRACHQIRSDVVAGLCRPCRGRRAHRRGLRGAPETAAQPGAGGELAAGPTPGAVAPRRGPCPRRQRARRHRRSTR